LTLELSNCRRSALVVASLSGTLTDIAWVD
jgi:hypothetical protein